MDHDVDVAFLILIPTKALVCSTYLVSNSLGDCLLNVGNVFGLITGIAVPVQLLHGAEPHPGEEEGHALWPCKPINATCLSLLLQGCSADVLS